MFGVVYQKIWPSDGVYLNIATEFIWHYKLRFRLRMLHICSLKGGKRTILELINNVAFAWHGNEPPTLWSQIKHETTKGLAKR